MKETSLAEYVSEIVNEPDQERRRKLIERVPWPLKADVKALVLRMQERPRGCGSCCGGGNEEDGFDLFDAQTVEPVEEFIKRFQAETSACVRRRMVANMPKDYLHMVQRRLLELKSQRVAARHNCC